MSDVLLKIHPNGQWEMISKNLVVPVKEGGVVQDTPQPEVGFRGKQGRMQPQGDNDPNPKPKKLPGSMDHHVETSTSVGPNRTDLGIKTFDENGTKIK